MTGRHPTPGPSGFLPAQEWLTSPVILSAAKNPQRPVARNIYSSQMRVGHKCAVILFDSTNLQDAVVAAVWA